MNKPRETAVIENITPLVDCGRHSVKRSLKESVRIEADIFKDGHDVLSARLLWRRHDADDWCSSRMWHIENDRWTGMVVFREYGAHEVVIEAWGDPFLSWREEFRKKFDAGQKDLTTELEEGARLLEETANRIKKSSKQTHKTRSRVPPPDAVELLKYAADLRQASHDVVRSLALNSRLAALMARNPDLSLATRSRPLPVQVDRDAAVFAAWYEFFPRSAEGHADRGSKLRDCLPRVDYARAMGFDVIYFPPIHPIGFTKRKGPNNSLVANPGDPGVPYAIGAPSGGHFSVEPELGTLADFDWLVGEIRARGMEVAIDFAINCSPDHPYVKEHPEWFFHRPDGSIKYAENPPKKYEDIYPLNFHAPTWRALWDEMRDIILFWCRHGVRIFRVDNPHTKPVAFWEYLIAAVQAKYPDVIFLSEAFTKPKMMRALAKAGFTQSYTYFTWRNTAQELREYVVELTQTEMKDYFRGNFFTNTPDILPFYLQYSGRPGFLIRVFLAATLSSVYGIYSGFELCENTPMPGKEEYWESEKYQFKARNWDAPGHIKDWIARINNARRSERALQYYSNVEFHGSDNPELLVYSKVTEARESCVFCVAATNPHNRCFGHVEVPLARFGILPDEPYLVEDLLLGESYVWRGAWCYVELDPHAERAAHLFKIRRWSSGPLSNPIFAT